MDSDDLLRVARETITGLEWCFAITAADNQDINARLVQVGRLRDDWSVRFMTDRRCRKVREIERSGRLTLAYQNVPDRVYVALIGGAIVTRDVEAKRMVWRPETYRFHPGGPEDPNNVLVVFQADRIELYSVAREVRPEPLGFAAAVLFRHGSEWHYEASSRW